MRFGYVAAGMENHYQLGIGNSLMQVKGILLRRDGQIRVAGYNNDWRMDLLILRAQPPQARIYHHVVLDEGLEMFPMQPDSGGRLQVVIRHRVWRESLLETFLDQPAAQNWFEHSDTNITEHRESQQ